MREGKSMAKYTKTIMKFQRPIVGSTVLMYNEERSIIGELTMDKMYEILFGDRYEVYCECKYRNSDGYLEIGKEVDDDF